MKKRRIIRSAVFVVISLGIVLAITTCNKGNVSPVFISSSSITTSAFPTTVIRPGEFVYRFGTQLMLNGYLFRFAGANMHWLALDESANYPSQYQVNDGLETAKEMGVTVVRSHNLGISVGCSNCIEPSLGVFNETAFAHVDDIIKEARDHGIRLIIPLTDNWHFAEGGKHTFTDWRRITDENQFYFNPQVIRDFEKYIGTLLNHVNLYTGIAYKNDPTIMAWETGNELNPPTGWTQIISTYIKAIDHNHLVIDGRSGIDPNAASLKNVDIVSHHYYPKSIAELENDAKTAQKAVKALLWESLTGTMQMVEILLAFSSQQLNLILLLLATLFGNYGLMTMNMAM